ncbi:MAG: PAS domain S-box protein [Holophagaceae bacterium]|nr:PAS domain S-box protein [Holophagaceae bacterium]
MDAAGQAPLKILLIEDNPADIRYVKEMLRGMGSIELLSETRLSSGLARMEEASPSLVLLDMGLPDSQGLATVQIVLSRAASTPVVVLTGMEDASMGLESLKLGAQDYLIKSKLTESALARVIHYSIERKQLEVRAKESEKLYRLISDNASEVIALFDIPLEKFSYLSPSVEKITGFAPSEFAALPLEKALTPESYRALKAGLAIRIPALEAGDESQRVATDRYSAFRKDGSVVPTETVTTLLTDPSGKVAQVLGVSRLITDRVQLEEDRQNISDLYATLSHANEAIIHSASEDELLAQICQVCVQYGLFDLAWIGTIAPEGDRVEVRASYGPFREYIAGLRIPLGGEEPESHGPTARCLAEGRPFITSDWLEEACVQPWRAKAYAYGIRSSAAFPIQRGAGTFGVLNLYSRTHGFFKPDRIALLEELVADLAYALDNIDHEALRKQSEEALKESEIRFRRIVNGALEGIWTLDPDDRTTVVNPRLCDMLGYSEAEMLGRPVQEFLGPVERAGLLHLGGKPGQADPGRMETRFLRKDGSLLDVRISAAPIKEAGGLRLGSVAMLTDISEEVQRRRERDDSMALLNILNTRGSTKDLLEDVVAFLKRWSGCEAVGIRLKEGDDFPYFKSQGFSPEFLQTEDRLCRRDPEAKPMLDAEGKPVLECMCGDILRGRFDPANPCFTEGGSFWTNSTTDLLADPMGLDTSRFTRGLCIRLGFESIALAPFQYGQEIQGLIQLNDRAKGRFTLERIHFLERMAEQIAMALSQRQTQEKLQLLLDSTGEAIYGIDLEGRCTFCNPACVRILGFHDASDLLGKNAHALLHHTRPDGTPFPPQECRILRSALKGERSHVTDEVYWKADGTSIPVEYSSYPQMSGKGPVGGVVTFLDITERKKSEDALHRLNRELRAISSCNQTLIHAEDEPALLESVCHIVCEEAGYRMAWVGYAEQDEGKTVRPVAWAGDDSGYIAAARLSWDGGAERGQGPCGIAIREGRTVHVQDIAAEPCMAPWHKGAREHGYRSTIVLPLADESGKPFGAFLIYSTETALLTPAEIQLLEELAADLAFGIVGLRARAERKLANEALQRSEAGLKDAQRMAHIGNWDLDLRSGSLAWTDEIYRIFEIDPGAFGASYEAFLEAIHPDDRDFVNKAYTESVKAKVPYDIVHRLLMKDGRVKYVNERCETFYDEAGTPLRSIGTVQDITERKRAEESMAASEKRFRDLVETISDWVWEVDEQGRYSYCSPKVRDLLGYEPQEVIGRLPFDLMPAAEAERVAGIFKEVVAERKPMLAIENINRHKDGHEVVMETSGAPVFDVQGAFKGYRGIDRDITERKRAQSAALEQFKLAETIFNHSLSCLVVLDRNFNFVRVNEAYARGTRKESGELIGRNHFELYPSDAQAIFEEVVREKHPFTTFTRAFVYPDQPERGTTYWDWTLVPILDSQGEVEYLVFSLNEVTERKRAEEVQRATALYMRSLIEASLDPLLTISPGGQITDVNKTTEEVTGVERERLIGTDFADYFTEPGKARAGYQEVLAKGYVRDYPLTIRHRSGRTTDVLYNATVYRNEAGDLQGVFAAARDITERKRAEEALRQSEESYRRQAELYQLAQRATQDAIWDWDLVADRTVWGDSVLPMLGYMPQDVGSAPQWHTERVHPEDRERVTSSVQEVIGRGGSDWSSEYRFQRSDGTYANVLDRGYVVRDSSGNALRMIGAMSDLTERIRAEQAQAASQAKSEFLATMTHEIRTPMIGMMGMVEILSHTKLDTDQRTALDTISASARSLLRIIGDILDFSKIEAGKLELEPQVVSLGKILEETFASYSSGGAQKGLEMRCELDSAIAPAHLADPVRFGQIIGNFLSNALKFTRQGSVALRAKVTASDASGQTLAIQVTDTGIGISRENQQRLFQPFVQGESSTTRRFGGSGLGLSIARRLAQMMGGAITMESEEGKGTTLTFAAMFPIAEPSLLDRAAPEPWSPREAPPREVAEAARGLVLLVEDHPTNRLVLMKQLGMAGYQADAVEDGVAALEAMGRTTYGLVLTDIQMPRMDGYQLAREIRKIEEIAQAARTPVLAVTANALKGEYERCLEAGMDDCIIKPVSIPDLDAKLRKWMPAAAALMCDLPTETPRAEAAPDTPAAEPPLDLGFLGGFCKGDRVSALEILRNFCDSTRADLTELSSALSAGSPVETARYAHRIKGSSLLVGAKTLADSAQVLEQAARTGSGADLEPLVKTLRAAFKQLELFLEEQMVNSRRG